MSALFSAERSHDDPHPWFAEIVFGLDGVLRQRHNVVEFTTHPACILRIQIGRAERGFTLADGIRVQAGGSLIHLHFWNEQVPRVPAAGPTIGWARRFCAQMELSFRELARHCEVGSELDAVVAVGANVTQGTRAQRAQLRRIMRHYGFEAPRETARAASSDRLRRLGENILISAMVLARNPTQVRADTLWRDRTQLFISRAGLVRRFGTAAKIAGATKQAEGSWHRR
jgi:hypothetical protein